MRTIKVVLSIAMIILMFTVSTMNTFAINASDDTSKETIVIINQNDNYNTRANYLVIDNEAIYSSDKSWDQPNNYCSYRVYINNTSNETLYFTVSYGSRSYSDSVDANSSHTFICNNAQYVEHTIAFSSTSGSLSGTVSVRVSDTPLTVS